MSSSSQIAIGAHVDQTDPIAEAQARQTTLVQFFLGDPQGYKGPEIRYAGGAAALRQDAESAGIDLYVHAPYIVNVATTNNRIRIPSRKLLQQHMDAAAEIGAKGLIVHGGHVNKADDPATGFDNWRKAIEATDLKIPLLIENTAGGDNAMARQLDRIAGVWDAIAAAEHADKVGFCLDTCHAWAGGIELATAVEKVRADHRPDRPPARQRQPGRLRLRRRPARQLRQRTARRARLRRSRPRRRCTGHLRDAGWRPRAPGRLRVAARARGVRLSRRGLLAASALSGLLVGCAEEPARTAPSPAPAPQGSRRIAYGEDPSQFVELQLPADRPRATVVLLHGGYWYPAYGLEQLNPMSAALTALGFATWNVEYRRTGAGGGFPNTLSDVATAVDRLAGEDVPDGLTDHVVLLGHSAGGHLAVWAASRSARTPGGEPQVQPQGAISLAGVLDLTRAGNAPGSVVPVTDFMGAPPIVSPEDYALADPSRLVPAGCPVWAVHADRDDTVPAEQSTSYVALARAAGATVQRVVVPGDHVAVIDPGASCFPVIRDLVIEASS